MQIYSTEKKHRKAIPPHCLKFAISYTANVWKRDFGQKGTATEHGVTCKAPNVIENKHCMSPSLPYTPHTEKCGGSIILYIYAEEFLERLKWRVTFKKNYNPK